MITITISSDSAHCGKTTLAMELAKFLSERTDGVVDFVSDTRREVLNDMYEKDNSLEGLKIKIVDLNGNDESAYDVTTITVTTIPGEQ